MNNEDVHKIRPAGRHLLTIGRDLIQNQYAAIVELVKNAYDADSSEVAILFKASGDRRKLTISIVDNGHGMSRGVVVSKWLVPSTDDKVLRKTSPNGRMLQGRKGVGRYAASMLGDDLLLDTIDENGERTTVFVEWEHFENAEFLEDVEVLVQTQKCDAPPGTKLIITGSNNQLEEWDEGQIDKLKFELKKLISPVKAPSDKENKDNFTIKLRIDNLIKVDAVTEEFIQPYPIFDLYDYKISGLIKANGKGTVRFVNQKARNTIEEDIKYDSGGATGCGDIFVDVRVYDRDKDAIDQLIKRGLKDEKGDYVGKLQARQLLNQYNGIGVYRNDFRIRPMGDPDFDWLKLNEQRVQNPSLRIGSNQVIGYVLIQSEESSGLEEKSARDGLKENRPYKALKGIAQDVLSLLETRRFDYRKKAGLSRTALKVERELERLFAFDGLRREISNKLEQHNISKKVTTGILEIIDQEEVEKNKIVEDLKQTVAVYQGQATLGKIINVILHEGRKPLNFFVNQMPLIDTWYKYWEENNDEVYLDKIKRATKNWKLNADIFVHLFNRLDPLASGKRGKKKPFNLAQVILGSFQVFEKELAGCEITYEIECDDKVSINGWEKDFYVIFTNLIDNSFYWMVEKNVKYKKIKVNVRMNGTEVEYIDYMDSGPGIEASLIENETIFEPEFTTKPSGTGLGLAISGEAATRNDFELKAFESTDGAHFRIEFLKGEIVSE